MENYDTSRFAVIILAAKIIKGTALVNLFHFFSSIQACIFKSSIGGITPVQLAETKGDDGNSMKPFGGGDYSSCRVSAK
ncbi:MAG: hypothetical protein ACXVIG_01745 [Halobacteriota archaeon]